MSDQAGRRLLDAVHLPVSLFLLYYGTDALVTRDGPSSLEQTVPDWLTLAWSVALIVGGLLVTWGVATDRTRAESAGHGFHLFGLSLFFAAEAADRGDVVAVVILAAVALMRMRLLARSRAARREATRFLRGEV